MVDLPDPSTDGAFSDSPVGGFGAIAQKIKRRTTDLLALAILTIGLLAVGAKLGRWWKESPQDALPSASSLPQSVQWGKAGSAVTLEFGNLDQALLRQVIIGDAESAAMQLEEIAIAQLSNVSLTSNPPSPAERKLLKELESAPVSRSLPAGESVYRIGSDLPMVIVTKRFPDQSPKELHHHPRVICWARAFPQSEDRWLVILFHPANGSSAMNPGASEISFPKDSERIQSLSDAHGQSWIAFRGAGSIHEWQTHFDGAFQNRNWNRVGGWLKTGSGWTTEFQSPGKNRHAALWLVINENERCEGMLLIETLLPTSGALE